MRVIAGTARSLKLETVPSMKTRPTTDRIKETLFNMLSPDIPGARFLDLFSGSGAIGIEALSRGAACAVFVEQDRDAVRIIEQNLKFTKLADRAIVIADSVNTAIGRLAVSEAPFDLIFMDPPYDRDLEKQALRLLHDTALIGPETLLIFEASLDTDVSDIPGLGYSIIKEKKYKTNKHVWLKPDVYGA